MTMMMRLDGKHVDGKHMHLPYVIVHGLYINTSSLRGKIGHHLAKPKKTKQMTVTRQYTPKDIPACRNRVVSCRTVLAGCLYHS